MYSSGVQAGGIFVNEEAKKLIAYKFRTAEVQEAHLQSAQELEEGFENGKKMFADPLVHNIKLRVGITTRLNIDSINVSRGFLTLQGYVTKGFLCKNIFCWCLRPIRSQLRSHEALLSCSARDYCKCQGTNTGPHYKSKSASEAVA
jgi:hypothetical protein